MDHGSRVFLQLTLGYLIGRIVVSFAFLSAYHLLLRTITLHVAGRVTRRRAG